MLSIFYSASNPVPPDYTQYTRRMEFCQKPRFGERKTLFLPEQCQFWTKFTSVVSLRMLQLIASWNDQRISKCANHFRITSCTFAKRPRRLIPRCHYNTCSLNEPSARLTLITLNSRKYHMSTLSKLPCSGAWLYTHQLNSRCMLLINLYNECAGTIQHKVHVEKVSSKTWKLNENVLRCTWTKLAKECAEGGVWSDACFI